MRAGGQLPESLKWLQSEVATPRYKKFTGQIRKDFHRAGIDLNLGEHPSPNVVFQVVKEEVYKLLLEDFDSFLNLMYLVDVPESAFGATGPRDRVDLAILSSEKLLEREWEKLKWRESD